MSVRTVLSAILKRELIRRGLHGLSDADCSDIVGQLLEQLMDFELKLAAQELTDQLPKK